MAFKTKIDLSNNRQAKQFEKTLTALSGATSFGLPFSALTSGPDYTNSATTTTFTNVYSTFSGNSATTVYNWYYPNMSFANGSLSALTPINSGVTQSALGYSGLSSITVDGNIVYTNYTGVTFNITPTNMVSLGSGNYSGTVFSQTVKFFSAPSLDYSGRTIWVDVSGITRTQKLIVSDNAQIGYVLGCINSDGMVGFVPVSATSSTGIWVSGSAANTAVLAGGSNSATTQFSVSEGQKTKASGIASHSEGSGSTASGNYSHAEGFGTISSGTSSHAEGHMNQAIGVASHAEGGIPTDGKAPDYPNYAYGIASHAEGGGTIASGTSSHAEGFQTRAYGERSHAEGFNTTASGDASHAEGTDSVAYGPNSHVQNYYTIAIGANSHAGGSNTTASGDTSFVHGLNSVAKADYTIVLGNTITGTTANTTYVERLNIKTLGVYADNAAATSAGLEVGTLYRTSTGQLMIRY